MEQRITTLAHEAENGRAPWLHVIGQGTGRDEAIRQVVSYRAIYPVTGDDPLGPRPETHQRQRAAWTAAQHAIIASHEPTDTGSPADRILALFQQDSPTAGDDRPTDTRTGPTIHL